MIDNLFFDTDCISSFLWVNDTHILRELYGGKIILPESVYIELSNPSIPHLKQRVDAMVESNDVSLKELVAGTEEYRLYVELVRGKEEKAIEKGEATGIALAKTYNGTLASNNYKDIEPYIKRYNLKHTDTAEILVEALRRKLITEEEGNSLWIKMVLHKRKLPTKTFSEYLSKHKIGGI